MRPATAATCASTNAAASRVSAGVEWMVTSATRRARQAGTRPAWTCAHSRGRRWRSSRAWPTSFFAAVVEMPRTVPSSARQNSATSGAPSPAMGSSCSQPGTVNVAAEWIDSGGCRSAHRAAVTRRSAAARCSAAFCCRASVSRSEAVRSSTSPAPGPASASIMCSILPATTDSDLPRAGACGRPSRSAVPGLVTGLRPPRPARAGSRDGTSSLLDQRGQGSRDAACGERRHSGTSAVPSSQVLSRHSLPEAVGSKEVIGP